MVLACILGTQRDHSRDSVWEGTHSLVDIAIALYGGIWAYDGWSHLSFLAGDMLSPKRDLPKFIFTAMPLVILANCIVKYAYFAALRSHGLNKSTSVVFKICKMTNSKIIELSITLRVALSWAGAFIASITGMVGLVQAAAQTGVHPKASIRIKWVLISQVMVKTTYCGVGEFKQLAAFYGAANYFFYLLTVAGLPILKCKKPSLHRPFKTWLVAPLLFTLLSISLLIRTTLSHPWLMLTAIDFILTGRPLYSLVRAY